MQTPINPTFVLLCHAYVMAGSFLVTPWLLLVGVAPLLFVAADFIVRGR